MNIKRELQKAQFKKDVTDRFKRAISIIRRFMCQHKDCASEIITVSLGNTAESILSELIGEEEAKCNHTMKLRRVYCLNCGREVYRETISYEEDSPKDDSSVPQE